MELFDLVQSRYPYMTKFEQKTAELFLSDPESFAFSTLDKVSRLVNTSTTTTIRFCRALGFDGYKEFQAAVRQQLKLVATLPDKLLSQSGDGSEDSLMSRIIERGIQNIYRTFNDVSHESLSNAVAQIAKGKRLFLFGMRESYALVHYAYTRFITVRDNVFILDAGQNGIIESVLNLCSTDVCVVFLFRRYTDLTVKLLPLMREQGAHIILVTVAPYDTLSTYADIILPCHLDIGSIKNSSLAPLCLIDYLYSAVSMESQTDLLVRMNRIEDVLQSCQIV